MVSSSFERFVVDQLGELGEVTSRRMFGGAGLYCDSVFFGLIAGDVLYLKVDDETRCEYEAAGMQPFRPYQGRPTTMKYYSVPVDVRESAPELVAWASKALTVARNGGGSPEGRSVSGKK
jgi:DNA transformation protein and related proteins